MKATKSFSVDLELLKQIQDISDDMKKSFNETVEMLLRHGIIRYNQMMDERKVLYPVDAEKLR